MRFSGFFFQFVNTFFQMLNMQTKRSNSATLLFDALISCAYALPKGKGRVQHLPAAFQHQGSFLKHQAVLTLNVRAVHTQLCLSCFTLRNEVLELRESSAQQLILFVLTFYGLLTSLLELGPALVSVFQVLELQEDSFSMAKHIFVNFHALPFAAKLFQGVLQRPGLPLFFCYQGRECLRIFLYLIIIICQESHFSIKSLVVSSQLMSVADMIENIMQAC